MNILKTEKILCCKAKMYEDVDYALNKILTDRKLEDKFEKIDKVIEESQNDIKHLLDPEVFAAATLCGSMF